MLMARTIVTLFIALGANSCISRHRQTKAPAGTVLSPALPTGRPGLGEGTALPIVTWLITDTGDRRWAPGTHRWGQLSLCCRGALWGRQARGLSTNAAQYPREVRAHSVMRVTVDGGRLGARRGAGPRASSLAFAQLRPRPPQA